MAAVSPAAAHESGVLLDSLAECVSRPVDILWILVLIPVWSSEGNVAEVYTGDEREPCVIVRVDRSGAERRVVKWSRENRTSHDG